jgi:hypothetical protein
LATLVRRGLQTRFKRLLVSIEYLPQHKLRQTMIGNSPVKPPWWGMTSTSRHPQFLGRFMAGFSPQSLVAQVDSIAAQRTAACGLKSLMLAHSDCLKAASLGIAH